MTLGLACVLVGSLLIYAGVKGLSFTRLLVGDNTTASQSQSVAA